MYKFPLKTASALGNKDARISARVWVEVLSGHVDIDHVIMGEGIGWHV